MHVHDLVDAGTHPSVHEFLKTQVEMQFDDLRVMLQLPKGDWSGGCNFAAANTLLNLISGFSVCLFEACTKALTERQGRGDRFKRFLETYYPWADEGISPEEGSNWLYNVARNPLAHSLGVQVESEPKSAGLAKIALGSDQIEEIERSSARPDWLKPTLFCRNVDKDASITFLSVPTLYWGVWRTMEGLTSDDSQMAAADGLLGSLLYPTS